MVYLNDWVDVTGSAYAAPLSWLRLSISSEHNNYFSSQSLICTSAVTGPR
jgi:hypothetical protein